MLNGKERQANSRALVSEGGREMHLKISVETK